MATSETDRMQKDSGANSRYRCLPHWMALESRHGKEVSVQISLINSKQLKFLDMSALILAFQSDPDLVNIWSKYFRRCMFAQAVFILPFLVRLGRLHFYSTFFGMQYL